MFYQALIILSVLLVISTSYEPFVWISANPEGLTQQLLQYIMIRNYLVHKCGRKLILSPYRNGNHNSDLGYRHIVLCDYFVFPNDTSCHKDYPKKIVETYHSNCVTPCNGTWDCSPRVYGISHCESFTSCNVSRRQIDLCKDRCGLLYPYGHMPKINYGFFKIDFQQEYYNIRNKIKQLMGIGIASTDYTAVHWRRGDQLIHRCGTLDNSVNCQTSKELIKIIKEANYTSKTIYIATNEKNVTELNQLTAAGYYTWHNLNIPMKLDSVQVCVVELMLMIDAQIFLHWGLSAVSQFSKRMKNYHKKYK